MQKTIRFWAVMSLVMMMFLITGCSGGSDDPSTNAADTQLAARLVGTWLTTESDNCTTTLVINEDGTFSYDEVGPCFNDPMADQGTWSVVNGSLHITSAGETFAVFITSTGKLALYSDDDDELFERSGSGTGLVGTWVLTDDGCTETLVINENGTQSYTSICANSSDNEQFSGTYTTSGDILTITNTSGEIGSFDLFFKLFGDSSLAIEEAQGMFTLQTIGDSDDAIGDDGGDTGGDTGGDDTQNDFPFTTDWLNGKTLYNVVYEDSSWVMAVFEFTDSTYQAYMDGHADNADLGTYTISEEGYIILHPTTGEQPTQYVRATGHTDDYLTLVWSDVEADLTNGMWEGSESFYFDYDTAKAFVDAMNADYDNSAIVGTWSYETYTGVYAANGSFTISSAMNCGVAGDYEAAGTYQLDGATLTQTFTSSNFSDTCDESGPGVGEETFQVGLSGNTMIWVNGDVNMTWTKQ